MFLYIFNPEHDIALAAHRARFTPPRAGRNLRHDIGFLPTFWAEADDFVLTDDVAWAAEAMRPYASVTRGQLIDRHVLSSLLRAGVAPQPVPWGWDLSVRQQLADCGMPSHLLPADSQLEQWRQISHRAWAAARLLPQLRMLPNTVGESWAAGNMAEVHRMIQRRGPVMVKAPWSSSGRGVRCLGDTDADGTACISEAMGQWMNRIISQQGCVMIEPYYDRVVDFGLEFESDGAGNIAYCGLSLFSTVHGSYIGNVLATEAEKRHELARHIDMMLVDRACSLIQSITAQLFNGVYAGAFGIDMMVVRTADGHSFHPCVELNLRSTMGHVALAMARRGLRGIMRVAYDGYFKLHTLSSCDTETTM